MKNSIKYIKVVLDENGNIVDFFSNLDNTKYKKEEVIGKNWFDIFIDPINKEKIFKVFKEIISGNEKDYETYNNDIKCKDGTHKFIDFYNKLIIKDGKKYTFSVGMEHKDYDKDLLYHLAHTFFYSSLFC
ncbi:PAS domain S-box protein [Nitrosophilus kaiyonis]|uniref:PAS domain S-box protein n=1 Tax=Nitrosophilus kaiyonis TaxID=2930200 RepID=UPI002490A6DF|nr:PAS domain S-box protein [Nitrosophilus kaiyonis]